MRTSLFLQGRSTARTRWRITPYCVTDAAPPPTNGVQWYTFLFILPSLLPTDLFLQKCYFKPHVERCQRVPVSVPSSLCVPMRQMLISCPGHTVVVSADLSCWLKPCVFLWPCVCLLAFLCAGIALPLYSYIGLLFAVCFQVPFLVTDG